MSKTPDPKTALHAVFESSHVSDEAKTLIKSLCALSDAVMISATAPHMVALRVAPIFMLDETLSGEAVRTALVVDTTAGEIVVESCALDSANPDLAAWFDRLFVECGAGFFEGDEPEEDPFDYEYCGEDEDDGPQHICGGCGEDSP